MLFVNKHDKCLIFMELLSQITEKDYKRKVWSTYKNVYT